MALVRCARHNIPYNDENPRGCPACARERVGGDPTTEAIRELARASQVMRAPPDSAVKGESGPARTTKAPPEPSVGPITTQPRTPEVAEGPLGRLLRLAIERRVLAGGAIVIVAVLLYLAVTAGPTFVEGAYPPRYSGTVHALPVDPGQPVEVVFTILGPRTPRAHPEEPSLAQYVYGTNLTIDGRNGVTYQITVGVPNWSWSGLTVGMSQRNAEGALALLGVPRTVEEPEMVQPQVVSRYAVYPSLERRPRRVLRAEVRPPNGCMDVEVVLAPRAIGELVVGDRRYAVIGPEGAPLEWVSIEVRAINRAASGPAGPAVCTRPGSL